MLLNLARGAAVRLEAAPAADIGAGIETDAK